MKNFIVGLLICALSLPTVPLPARDLLIVITGGKSFVINPGNNPGDRPVVEEVNVIIHNFDSTSPNPTPNPTTFEGKIKQMTEQVLANGGTKTTGAGISAAFSLVRDGLIEGTITGDNALDTVKRAIDLVLSIQTDQSKWTAWRTSVSEALLALQQEGKLKTSADYVQVFNQIVNGMNAATGFNGNLVNPGARMGSENQGILDNIDFQKLMELIKFIMELLKLFSPPAAVVPMPLIEVPATNPM